MRKEGEHSTVARIQRKQDAIYIMTGQRAWTENFCVNPRRVPKTNIIDCQCG